MEWSASDIIMIIKGILSCWAFLDTHRNALFFYLEKLVAMILSVRLEHWQVSAEAKSGRWRESTAEIFSGNIFSPFLSTFVMPTKCFAGGAQNWWQIYCFCGLKRYWLEFSRIFLGFSIRRRHALEVHLIRSLTASLWFTRIIHLQLWT